VVAKVLEGPAGWVVAHYIPNDHGNRNEQQPKETENAIRKCNEPKQQCIYIYTCI